MTPAHVGRVLGRLDGVRAAGDGWMAKCPSHEDKTPSLSLSIGHDGRLLANCHAGCSPSSFLNALRIDWKDLWPAQASTATTTSTVLGSRAFEIRDADGHLVAVHHREDHAEGKKMWWARPDGSRGLGGVKVADLPLFGVEFLRDRPGDPVVVVEGEKAALALRKIGILAAGTVTGASSCPGTDALRPLLGREVTLWPDHDLPGRAHMSQLGVRLATLGGKGISSVLWPAGTPIGHDAADLGEDDARALLAKATTTDTTTPISTTGDLARRVIVTRASDIAPRPVTWAWESRLPQGMFSLVAGREGTGKSMIISERIARLTRGQLPGVHMGHPRSVVIVATEDSWAHTLVPRLMAAGADLDRVLRLQVHQIDLGTCELSLPDDLDVLRDVIPAQDVAMVVLDPLISRLSRKLDTHRDAEVRQALEPLARLADEANVSLVGIIHVNKTTTKDPLTSVMASRGFVAVARAVLFAVQDPADRSNRVLSLVKCNVGPDDSSGLESLAYRVEGATVETPEGPAETSRIVWTGIAEQGVREMLAAGDGEEASAREDAEEFLRDLLAAGALESDKVKSESRAAGLSWATVRRAKDAIGIRPAKSGGEFGGTGARWYWHLPPQGAQPLHKMLIQKSEHLVGNVSTLCETAPADPPARPAVADPPPQDVPAEPAEAPPEQPKADPGTYLHDGITYRLGDTLPDGRVFIEPGPILSKRPPEVRT